MASTSRRHFLAGASGIVLLGATPAIASAATPTHMTVTPALRTGRFNRKLFSVVGVTQDTGLKADSWALLNPAGTQSRLGLDMNGLVPEKGAFDVSKMFLYMDNTNDKFFNQVTGAGMEPVILCAYDMSWLGEHGHSNDPPSDPQEWADVIVQVAQHFNADCLRVRYLEIWNEPNTTQFWTGTAAEYVTLFQTTARTVHARCPGVQVGGPVFSPGVDGYYDYGKAFIDAAGDDMDYFIYHSYGDDPPKIASDIELWRDYIAAHTRHRRPKLMVTEAETFKDSDAVKLQNLIQRQFTLLNYAETMIGWHQFKLYEYKEGWYTFGLVYNDGSVFNRNYWAYWLFRDADGDTIDMHGPAVAGLNRVATISDDGRKVNVVLWLDGGVATGAATVSLDVVLAGLPRHRRIRTISKVSGLTGAVVSAGWANDPLCRQELTLQPGDAYSLTFDVPTEVPWLGLSESTDAVSAGAEFTATATVVNTTAGPISGQLSLAGLPAGWTTAVSAGNPTYQGIPTGGQVTVSWTITAASAGTIAYRAQIDGAHSIPIRISVT